MPRRLAALLLVTVLGAAGCGGHDSKPSTALDDAVGYFAKDAPFVAAVETDPDGPQLRQVRSLAGALPVTGLLADRVQRLTGFDFVRYGRDIRPQLGAPLVIGLTRPAGRGGIDTVLVAALRVKSPAKAKQFLLRQPGFVGDGKSSGVRIYQNVPQSRYAAVDGDVLLLATNRDILEQALAMHRSDNRMRESGFERDVAGLPAGALVRVSADPRTMIGVDPRLRPALDVKWLASMRRLGATLKALPNGAALDFRIATDAGSLTNADLPLAPKPGVVPLIGGKDKIQVGVREPGRLARLAVAVWKAIAPKRAALAKRLQPAGVDLERQLPRHLADVAVVAFDPFTREFAARAAINDAPGVKSGIEALAPVLPAAGALFGFPGLGLATPEAGENFYALAKPNGKTVVFGVVGNSLVAASKARTAAALASEPTHTVPGPPVAAVVTADARELAGKLLAKTLKGPAALAAPFVLSALRDVTGRLTISRAGLRGHLKLTVVR
jgi:hypothetical protein